MRSPAHVRYHKQRCHPRGDHRLAGRPEDPASSPIPPEEGFQPALLTTLLDWEKVLGTPPPSLVACQRAAADDGSGKAGQTEGPDDQSRHRRTRSLLGGRRGLGADEQGLAGVLTEEHLARDITRVLAQGCSETMSGDEANRW